MVSMSVFALQWTDDLPWVLPRVLEEDECIQPSLSGLKKHVDTELQTA